MQSFFEFLLRHWELSGLFLLLALILIIVEIRSKRGISTVTPQEVVFLMNHKKGVVLDIRQTTSFAEGHILGAIHVPKDDVEREVLKLKKYTDKPVVVTCDFGRTALDIATLLQRQGFSQVVILDGGMQQWKAAGLPIHQEASRG